MITYQIRNREIRVFVNLDNTVYKIYQFLTGLD